MTDVSAISVAHLVFRSLAIPHKMGDLRPPISLYHTYNLPGRQHIPGFPFSLRIDIHLFRSGSLVLPIGNSSIWVILRIVIFERN